MRGGPDALHTNTLGPSCTCPVVVAAGGAAGVTRAASCLGSLTFTAALVAAHPMISMRMEARLEWLSFFATRHTQARRERQMRGDLSSRPPRPALPALAPQIALGRYPAASFLSTCLETRTSPCICIGTRAAAAEGAGPRGCKDARARGHGALAWLVIPQPWVPKRCPQRPYPASTSTLIVKWGTSWNKRLGYRDEKESSTKIQTLNLENPCTSHETPL